MVKFENSLETLNLNSHRPQSVFFKDQNFLQVWLDQVLQQGDLPEISTEQILMALNQIDEDEWVSVLKELDEIQYQEFVELTCWCQNLETGYPFLSVDRLLWLLRLLLVDESGDLFFRFWESLELETSLLIWKKILLLKPKGTLTKDEEEWCEENLPLTPDQRFFYSFSSEVPEGEQPWLQDVIQFFYQKWDLAEKIFMGVGFFDERETEELVNQFRLARMEDLGFWEQGEGRKAFFDRLQRVSKKDMVLSNPLPSQKVASGLNQFAIPWLPDYVFAWSWLSESSSHDQRNLAEAWFFWAKLVSSVRFSAIWPGEEGFLDSVRAVWLAFNWSLESGAHFLSVSDTIAWGFHLIHKEKKDLISWSLGGHRHTIPFRFSDGNFGESLVDPLVDWGCVQDLKAYFLAQEDSGCLSLANLLEWNPLVFEKNEKLFLKSQKEWDIFLRTFKEGVHG